MQCGLAAKSRGFAHCRLHALREVPRAWAEGQAELALWSEVAWAHVPSGDLWKRMALVVRSALGLSGALGRLLAWELRGVVVQLP